MLTYFLKQSLRTILSFGSRIFTRRGSIICQSSLCTRPAFLFSEVGREKYICGSPDGYLGEPHKFILLLRLEAVCCSKTAVEQTCSPEMNTAIICIKADSWSYIDCETDWNILKENTKLS